MKILLTTIVAALAFATSMAFATTTVATNDLPWVPVNISGSITYLSTNSATKGTLKTISFNTKSLITLLNASPSVTNTLNYATGVNQIPAGSYLVWDINDSSIFVTNKNGFAFNLQGYAPSYYDWGYLTPGNYYNYPNNGMQVGSYSFKSTGAGSEQDLTIANFYFDDNNGNEISSYGNGTLNWNFGASNGATNNAVQTASVTVKMQPAGWYAYVNGDPGVPKNMSISGSGSSIIYVLGEPFFLWWNP